MIVTAIVWPMPGTVLSRRYSGRKLTRSLRRLSNASICCPNAWLTARLASMASAKSGANANASTGSAVSRLTAPGIDRRPGLLHHWARTRDATAG